MFVATIVREYSQFDTTVTETEEQARAWLVEQLYLVEEGLLEAGDPTPPMAVLYPHAGAFGWKIAIEEKPGTFIPA